MSWRTTWTASPDSRGAGKESNGSLGARDFKSAYYLVGIDDPATSA